MQTSFFGNAVDLSNTKPAAEFAPRQEPVPENWYPMMLIDIETRKESWGIGANVTFKIVEGELAGREVKDFFIFVHSGSAKANDIGQERLRAWCDALGLPPNITSADPLVHKTVYAKVRVEQGKDYQDKKTGEMRQGRPQNRIDTFKAYGAAPAAPAYQPQPYAAAPAPAYQPAPQQYAPQPQHQQPVAPTAPPAAGPRGPMPWEKRA